MTTPRFIRLTDVDDGEDLWVNVSHIDFVTRGSKGAIVSYPGDDGYHKVTESVDEVMRKINGDGSES